MSIHDMILPPKMVPRAFASEGSTISVIVTVESFGLFEPVGRALGDLGAAGGVAVESVTLRSSFSFVLQNPASVKHSSVKLKMEACWVQVRSPIG
jgi:hypothetical protein